MRSGLFTVVLAAKPKIAENGEDAYAYSYRFDDEFRGYIAAFDGCGGMGAKKYEAAGGKTGAYLASRLAAFVTDQFYMKDGNGDLEEMLREAFNNAKNALSGREGVVIRSSLFKDLPTTAAIAETNVDGEKLRCRFMWAGDSRCYYIDKKGICQMTDDDVYTEEDAFTSLRSDAKMSNVIYAGGKFRLNCREAVLSQPALVIAATDGAFGYFQTPMHFEFLVLATMLKADSPEEWQRLLNSNISNYTGDDYTFIAAAFGFSDFSEMKSYFSERCAHLRKEYMMHCTNASEEGLKQLWENYRTDYYRR